MSQSKSLLKNTLIYTIGNLGSKIFTFLLLPFFSFYLGLSDLGTYDLVVSSLTLLVPIVTLQVSDSVYRWLLSVAESNIESKKNIISNGFFSITIGLFIFCTIYLSISSYFKLQFTGYFSVLIVTYSYMPFFQSVLRGLGKTKLYSISSLINAFLILILNIVFLVFLNLKLESLFIAIIIANLITILFVGFKIKIWDYLSKSKFDLYEIKKMLKFSLPLVPNIISWWLINASDKFIILYLLSINDNGIYAVSSRFPTILTLFNSIFILAWQDYTITAEEKDKHIFDTKVFNQYINFELSLALILIATSEVLVKYSVSSEYYEAYKYMPLLYIGVAFSAFSGFFGAAFLREKKTKGVFISSITGGVINVVISFCLMKKIGLFAPALGTFVSFVVVFFMRVWQTRSFFQIKINYNKLFYFTLLCLIFSFFIFLNNKVLNNVLILFSIILVAIINKEMFKNFYRKILTRI